MNRSGEIIAVTLPMFPIVHPIRWFQKIEIVVVTLVGLESVKQMKIKAVSGIMLTLLLTSMLTLAFNMQLVKASGTIYITSDYTFTHNIYEPIVVLADNIVINGNGYTLHGTGSGKGIYLSHRSNVTIENTKIEAFGWGIYLIRSSNITISVNNITNNYIGIYLSYSLNNNISGNNIRGNTYGLELFYSSNYNSVSGNKITNNRDGIYPLYSLNNNISGNKITGNNWRGIYLRYSLNNSISGNNITGNNATGIELGESSHYNSISGNNITANKGTGIYLFYFSHNSISGNNIAHNRDGIKLWYSDYNSISGNNITKNNRDGVSLGRSSHNSIYHNNLVDNIEQVRLYYSINNVWDDGYPSGGNYWSDHVMVDDYSGKNQDKTGSDGIVDEPYIIDYWNRDNYPLVEPWSPPPQEDLEELIETIKSWNLPVGTENSLTSKLEEAILLLNQGNENGAVHKLMDFIRQVQALREDRLTNEQADYLIAEAQRIIDVING